MTTTIELSDQDLADLKSFTQQADAASAIRMAMVEFLRFSRRQRLKSLSGQVQMEENWPALEEAEMGNRDGSSGTGTH